MLRDFSVYGSDIHTDLAFSSSISQRKLHSELMMNSSEALQAGDLSKERPGASQNKFQIIHGQKRLQ